MTLTSAHKEDECCFIPCTKDAEFAIYGASSRPDDDTYSCEEHVGAMLGSRQAKLAAELNGSIAALGEQAKIDFDAAHSRLRTAEARVKALEEGLRDMAPVFHADHAVADGHIISTRECQMDLCIRARALLTERPEDALSASHHRGDHYNGQPGGCALCPADFTDEESERSDGTGPSEGMRRVAGVGGQTP